MKQDMDKHTAKPFNRELTPEMEKTKTVRFDAFWSVIIDSFTSLLNNRPAPTAASIAYYTLFSIFPLFLLMIVVLSYFLEVTVIQQEIITFLSDFLPGSETLIIENMQSILNSRASTSVTAAISLLWSGSGMFSSIISNIQYAWPESKGRGYFINRFFAVVGIVLLLVIVVIFMVFSIIFNLSDALAFFGLEINNAIQVIVNLITSYLVPVVLLYYIGYLLFRYIPPVKVDKQAARIGAALFSISWRLFTTLFGAYILSPLNRYDVLYGSVTTIVILLLYVYISSFLVLYPAHLVAAITHYKQKQAGLNLVDSEVVIPSDTTSINTSADEVEQKISTAKTRWNIKSDYIESLKSNAREKIITPANQALEKIGHNRASNKRISNAVAIIKQSVKDMFRWK